MRFPLFLLLTLTFEAADLYAATPFIDTLSPPSASPGTGPLLVTIHGANFAPGVIVHAGSETFTPTLLSAGRLAFTLPGRARATPHTAAVWVTLPGMPRGSSSNTVLFPIGNLSPTVSTTQTFFPFTEPRGLANADFNLDGNVDVVVTSLCTLLDSVCSPGKITVLPGTGMGGFEAPIPIDVCPSIGPLAVGDFNNDGKPDIAALCEDGVQILTGNGNGHFQVSPVIPFLAPRNIVQILSSLLVADVNSDGNTDLLVGGSPGLGVLLGDGAGGFAPVSIVCAACVEVIDMTAGDFNNDGKPDVAAVTYYDPNVTLLLGDGAGGFTIRKIPTGFDSYAVAAADFNADGNTDIVAGAGSNPTGGTMILFGDGTGAFTNGPRLSPGIVRKLVPGDLNGDGRMDLAVSTDRPGLLYALADNTGDFALSPANLPGAGAASFADFNNDGKLDIAVIGPNDSRLTILIQTPVAPTRPEYTITDICLPLSCYAWLLSDNAVAAGHNFAVYPGTGLLDFVERTGETFEPTAINKAGVIVGSAGFVQGQNPGTGYAAVWSPRSSELLNLDSVFGWTHGIATSINNAGVIVGYSPGAPLVTNLVEELSLNTVAVINDSLGILATDNTGPLYYDHNLPAPRGVTRLPVPFLSLYNSAGEVLLSAPQVGSLFTPVSGITSQPPAPGFNVVAFNNAGQFIGRNVQSGSPGIYTAATGVVLLNSLLPAGSTWTIIDANAINNSGQILASANNGARNTTVLLTPVVGAPAPGIVMPLQQARPQPEVGRRIFACESLTFNMRDICRTPVRAH